MRIQKKETDKDNVLKRICLGTVQFGLDYGVNNDNGKPAYEEVKDILHYASSKNIDLLDTAWAYGDAENRIGKFIASEDQAFSLITKVRPNIVSEHPKSIIYETEKSINESMERLGVDKINGCLLHTPSDYYNDEVMKVLRSYKQKGIIENIGVSIYEVEDALNVVKDNSVDYLQVMYNVFDQRLDEVEFWKYKQKSDVVVFARSVFLQGLLTMNPDKLPVKMKFADKYLRRYREICNQFNKTPQEVALIFALSKKEIDYLVLGVDSLEQLKENMRIVENYEDNSQLINCLMEEFSMLEKAIYFPSLWS